MIIRMTDTAINPEDADRAKQLFLEKVRPAFEAFDGCRSVDLLVGLSEQAGGFVDVALVSRWESEANIRSAVDSPSYEVAMSDLKSLFEQNPIVRQFDTVE